MVLILTQMIYIYLHTPWSTYLKYLLSALLSTRLPYWVVMNTLSSKCLLKSRTWSTTRRNWKFWNGVSQRLKFEYNIYNSYHMSKLLFLDFCEIEFTKSVLVVGSRGHRKSNRKYCCCKTKWNRCKSNQRVS